MNQDNTTQKTVTTIENQPQRTIKETTMQAEPQVKGEAPQKVYEKKKAIFRFNQVIWYVLGLVEVLFAFRVILKVLGANSLAGFTSLIYSLTTPLADPFNGILGVFLTGKSIIEPSVIIAAFVYFFIAWSFVYLMNLLYPITPKDIEVK